MHALFMRIFKQYQSDTGDINCFDHILILVNLVRLKNKIDVE